MKNWKNIVVSPDTPLKDAMTKINASGIQVALILSPDYRLLGVLTDGDFRRAILMGKSLAVPVSEVMSTNPTTVIKNTPFEDIIALMRRTSLHHIPMVDEDQRVVGLVTLSELVGVVEHPNWIILMAGGLGTRLRPYTNDCPKPMLEITGKPILEIILERFIEQGFKHFFISINYKGEMIREYFGNGAHWGVTIEYLHEHEQLGTAGGLSLLQDTPNMPVIVMNGDLLTQVNFDSLLLFHNNHDVMATMAVRAYEFQVPYGVVALDGMSIQGIDEKPLHTFFVNAGIYVLSPHTLNYLPKNKFFDMPHLFEHLIALKQKTAAYPLQEYWLDIGSMNEFEKAQREWEKHSIVNRQLLEPLSR